MSRTILRAIEMRQMPTGSSYLSELPVVKYLYRRGSLAFESPVTFLVGENGCGKSTLLEGIAVAMGFNAEGGSKNFTFSTRATHSELFQYLTPIRNDYPRDGFFLRAESLYNVATNIDDLDSVQAAESHIIQAYGGISLHKQSHGESFLAVMSERFRGNGLYILDEPEAALSPGKLMRLICVIDDLVKKHSQLIIATHSPILMAYPKATIYQISDAGIETAAYRETEHYQLTRAFLEAPEKMLGYLLK